MFSSAKTSLPKMNCGGTPILDRESTIGAYFCDRCFAVIGSMSQPAHCVEINDKVLDE